MSPSLEHIPKNKGESIVAFEYELKSFDAPWHFHPQLELTYIKKSNGIRYVGNHISTFAEDDLVLIGPALPHYWKNSKSYHKGALALVVQWDQHVLGNVSEFDVIHKLMVRAKRGIHFSPTVAQRVLPQMEKVVQSHGVERYLKFIQLLHDLSLEKDFNILSSDDFIMQASHDSAHRIQIIYEYVMEKFSSRITLAEVADKVHMTEESFSRFFSKTMQKPFFAYLNEYRINVAAKMLLESDLSITQIAFASGYESLPFFYKQFRKYKNISPKVFCSKFKVP